MAKQLEQLIEALPEAEVKGSSEAIIHAIHADSRQVAPGSLFVAYQGIEVDGHDYVDEALAQGANAVVAERVLGSVVDCVPLIVVPNGREALAHLAAAWNGYPARRLTVIGITGTDGKSTTCNLLYSILKASGRLVGLVTTVNAVIGERAVDTGLHTTTPDAPDIQRYLAEMVEAGMEIAILESTSHGLEQYRVAACDFDIAVVTNITYEHLDLHGSLAAYQQAKARLVHHLCAGYRKPGIRKTAILNADDDSYLYLRCIPADRWLAYSLEGEGDVVAAGVRRDLSRGTRFAISTVHEEFELQTPLDGDYNIYNILAAASAALALNVPSSSIQQGVHRFEGLVGRMERVDEGQDFIAIVDFAHTPNSLEKTLEAARTLTRGRVIAVYGSAGKRDVAKRAMMGEIGARLADISILTAEDPRTESLGAILDEMAKGAELAGAVEGENYHVLPDRTDAIQFAVNLAETGDVVITLGKGHEQSMCFGHNETPWSEHEALRSALNRRKLREDEDRV